jgi:outer membrane protein insertion porin family
LTLSTAEEAKRYGANFTEPAFLGRDVAFGFNLDVAESNSSYTTYDSDQGLIQPSIAFPVGEQSRLKLTYTGKRTEMLARSTPVHGVLIGSEIAAGAETSSALGYQFSYDTRIGGLNPNAGALLQFGQDFSGLGGDGKYIKTTAKAIGETKVMSEEVTLRASIEGGALSWQGGTNRAVDRFLLTPTIIRGFEPGGIGPRDTSVSGDDPIGGNLYVAARFEAEFPLGLPEEYGIGGGVFYDVANLWDLSDVTIPGGSTVVGADGSFRHVIGASILWTTPLGPLRFNFTNALKKETYDKEQAFEVTLSTRF